MRHVLLLGFILFGGSMLYAQEISEADSLEKKPAISVHIIPSVQWNVVFGRFMAYGASDVESVFREHLTLGVFSEVMLGTFIKRTVFPNIYEFSNYKYGISAGYNFPVSEKLQVISRLKVSRQKVKWTEKEGQTFSLSDECMELRPLAGFYYLPYKRMLMGGTIGYNFSSGLELSGIDQKDMNGLVLSLNIGIKL